MRRKGMQRFRHVAIPQIPCTHASPEHRAVIFLGISHEACVLFSGKEFVLRHVPVAMHVFVGAALQIDKLLNDFLLTGLRYAEPRGVSVGLFIFAKVIKAGVAFASPSCSSRVHLFQIAHDLAARSVQTVEIESVETCVICSTLPFVVLAKPSDKFSDNAVPPHPGRESGKAAKSLLCCPFITSAANVSIHAVSIRPVSLGSNGLKTFFLNEPLCNLGTMPIKLMRPM